MKTSVKLCALVAMVFAIGACDELGGLPTPPIQSSDTPFTIEAVPAGDFTKATDTAFEVGDAVSVFGFKGAEGNVLTWQSWITNGRFTKSESGFTPDQTYYWYEGEELGTVVGLYPYNAAYTQEALLAEGIEFCVKSDQSTHAGYTASDLMAAVRLGVAPTAEKVVLEFNHLLSKLVIDINNQTSATISEVYVDGVKGNINYSLTTNLTLQGGEGTIKAGRLALADEDLNETYVLVIPPQTASPSLAITTTDGTQYTYNASESIEFNSGKVRHLKVTITEQSISTEFDAIVNDWSADEDVEFADQPNTGGDNPENPENPALQINPNWRVEHVGDLQNSEGEIFHNGVLVEANDDGIFIFQFFHIDSWNSEVKDNLYEHIEATGKELAAFINDYNQNNGTSYTIVDINGVYQGPYSTYFLLEAEAGQYVAAMLGLTADGKVSGYYAVSDVFEIVATSEPTPYSDWLGTWKINDGNTESIITLTEDVANESYNMEGWNNIGGVPTKVKYNAENDALVFYGQTVAENLQSADGSVINALYFVGFGSDQRMYANVDIAKALWFRPEESKNVAMISSLAYTYPNEAGEEVNLSFGDVGYLLDIDGQLYYGTDVLHTVAEGMSMIRVTEPASAPASAPTKLTCGNYGANFKEFAPAKKAAEYPTGLFIAGECRFNF